MDRILKKWKKSATSFLERFSTDTEKIDTQNPLRYLKI